MKKIYFLMSALVLTVAMNAQQLAKMPKPELVKENIQSVVYTGELSAEGYAADAVPFKAPAAEERDTSLWSQYFINGQMYMSATPGYITGNCFLMTPFKDTTVYYSVYGPGKWVYETENEAGTAYETITVEDTAILHYPSPSYGWSYCNPTLSVYPRQIYSVDSTILFNVTFKDYMYGYGAENQWPGEIAPTNMMNSYWQPEQMTNCEMVTGDASGDGEYSWNRYMVSSGAAGTSWCFGSGMTISSWGAGTLDTLVNIIPIPEGASMWCDTVFVHCYNRDATDISQVFPATTDLKLTIYPITIEEDPETGKKTQWFRHDSIMAQATATQKECVEDGAGYSIQFVFKEKNVFGNLDVKPATFGQYCYAELTGFNESKCNFGIYCDYWETPTGGRTMWLKDNKFHSYGDMNIDMAFNAYYTNLHEFDGTWVNEVGGEGGALTMSFEDDEDGGIELSDTLMFACNISTDFVDDADLYDAKGKKIDTKKSDLIAKYNIITGPYTYEEGGSEYISLACLLTIDVKPNPTTEAREEVVYLQAYGAKLPIVIKQGVGTGLEKVRVLNDNVRYNIFGQKVDKAYKGVVILNGQKQLQ